MTKILSEEHKRKISQALKGRKFTPEHRQKKSLAQVGEKNPYWNGGKVASSCVVCGKNILDYRRGGKTRTHCSVACRIMGLTKEKVEKTCQQCGTVFLISKTHSDLGQGLFCSKSCKTKFMKPSQAIVGIPFTFDHKEKISQAIRGEQHYQWHGGTKYQDGYKFNVIDDRFMKSSKGNHRRYVQEHRQIAERILGRPLKYGEIVHHINGDKGDNRNCNLLICSMSYHAWLHRRMGYLYQQEHFDTLKTGVSPEDKVGYAS